MKNCNALYVKRWIVLSFRMFFALLSYIALFASPALACIEAYCQRHSRLSSAYLDSVWAPYEAWHERFVDEKGLTMATRNRVAQSSSNEALRYGMDSEPTTRPDRFKLQILIPLYIYPDLYKDNSLWKAVVEAQSHVDITAVINPDNGPLRDASDPRYKDYQEGLQALRDAKVKILGYVPTNYAKREKRKIQADIDTYILHYDIDGIFLDEAANMAEHKGFYAQLATYIRTKPKLQVVMLNPGVPTAPVYVDAQRSIADTVITFEQTYAHWMKASSPPPWVYTLTASRFALLVHTAPDVSAMKRAIDLGSSRHYGYVYITDDRGANPWDALPSYWQDMVHYIKQLNETRLTMQ
jgi:hypothetical protein